MIYKQEEMDKVAAEITNMAKRFKVTEEEVIFAAWVTARDVVWAKLERDKKC